MLGELLGEVVGWVVGEFIGEAIVEGLAWLVRRSCAVVLGLFAGWVGVVAWWVISLLGGSSLVAWWGQDPTSDARIVVTLLGCLALTTVGLLVTAMHLTAVRERNQSWRGCGTPVPSGARRFGRAALPSGGM